VAACAGIIVFGTLMGAMFIGQQFLRNVLGYDTLEAGAAILPGPCSWCSSRRARPSSSKREGRGSRC
jgi:DHA2 family multidrug resistance protein-like MFS transporter